MTLTPIFLPQINADVAGVNHDIARLSPVEPLSTMFVARLDSRSGILDYCSAGHPPALHLRANGQLELLSEGGPVLKLEL